MLGLLTACWPPEVNITSPPEAEAPLTSSPQPSTPAPSPGSATTESGAAPAPAAPAPTAPAPTAQPAPAPASDSDPCGLQNTRCCPPADACAEALRCDAASRTCVPAAEEPGAVAPPAPSYALRLRPGPEQLQVGGVGGDPFSALCPGDQVLIGIRAIADDNLWGLGIHCGRVLLSDGGDAVTVLPLDQFSIFGGTVELDPPPPLLELTCPAQSVVTALSWTLWQPFVDMQDIVQQVQLTCSELSVGPDRLLRASAAATVLAAGSVADGSSPVLQACGEQGVVSGVTGRAGGAIDALSTSCVTLAIEEL